MNLLFVGATGTVGRQLVPYLCQRHRLTLAAKGGGEVHGTPVRDVDVTDWESARALVAGGDREGRPFDAVINGVIAPYRGIDMDDPEARRRYFEQCLEINIRVAYYLFEAAMRAATPRFIYLSSLSTITGAPRLERIGPGTPDQPYDIYAASKLFGEAAGRSYACRFPEQGETMTVICLRLGQPYRSFIPWDEQWIHDPSKRRLPVHVEDIAHGVECALEVAIPFGVYPIVSGSDQNFIDPALYAELGYRPRWRFTGDGLTRLESVPCTVSPNGHASLHAMKTG
ncbi:MAG TPA: NAD(P)-dependent oxidoreductase [Chthoniobacteraceae bacterium]|nr:NAD(P)-dependent oxidoreductase [Chthoniobacteraceae bacterium]